MKKLNRRGFLQALGIGAASVPVLGSDSVFNTKKEGHEEQCPNIVALLNREEWVLNIRTNVDIGDKDIAIEIQDSKNFSFSNPRTLITFTKGAWLWRSRLPQGMYLYLRIFMKSGSKSDIEAWLTKGYDGKEVVAL